MPFPTWKRTTLKTFVDKDLGCSTAPCAKLVVAGFPEPVNTFVTGGAIIVVSDSKDKGNQDTDSTETDYENTSGKSALNEKMINKPDWASTILDNQVENREIRRQMTGNSGGNPQLVK